MVKHVVLFEFKKDQMDKIEEAERLLKSLKSKIALIQSIETGINFLESDRSFDLSLIISFKTQEDLAIYANHPEHVPVKDAIALMVQRSVSVDYEI